MLLRKPTDHPNTLSDWLLYLEQLDPTHIEMGLDRIRLVAQRLNLKSFSCPVITVAGTNGKGSTVALLKGFYQAAGYRVGCYTSPHLHCFTERIEVDGQSVTETALCEVFAAIKMAQQRVFLTYFEMTTLAALILLQKAVLDVVILEVGLGGRLDAVNIVDPTVSVITSIDLDHCEYLGATRDAIAKEKAGIFRTHIPAVCGDLKPPTSLLQAAQEKKASCYLRGRDFKVQQRNEYWNWQCDSQQYEHLAYPHLGIDNAATALMVVNLLKENRPVDLVAVQQGLQQHLIGRWQQLSGSALVFADVCHNPAAAQRLYQNIQNLKLTGRVHALCAMLKHKDLKGTLSELTHIVDQWYVTTFPAKQAASAVQLNQVLHELKVCGVVSFSSIQQGYDQILQTITKQDCLIVFGSFHTVAAVLEK